MIWLCSLFFFCRFDYTLILLICFFRITVFWISLPWRNRDVQVVWGATFLSRSFLKMLLCVLLQPLWLMLIRYRLETSNLWLIIAFCRCLFSTLIETHFLCLIVHLMPVLLLKPSHDGLPSWWNWLVWTYPFGILKLALYFALVKYMYLFSYLFRYL